MTMLKPRNAVAGIEMLIPGAIEASEAQGQRELVASSSLPSEIQAESRAILEKWGFIFGEPFKDDALFMPATLPPGWKKKGSDHDMWSHVVDGEGRERVAVFYKAAFYDRRADMRVSPRYRIEFGASAGGDSRRSVVDAKTGESLVVFEGDDAYEKSRVYFDESLPKDATHPLRWDDA